MKDVKKYPEKLGFKVGKDSCDSHFLVYASCMVQKLIFLLFS